MCSRLVGPKCLSTALLNVLASRDVSRGGSSREGRWLLDCPGEGSSLAATDDLLGLVMNLGAGPSCGVGSSEILSARLRATSSVVMVTPWRVPSLRGQRPPNGSGSRSSADTNDFLELVAVRSSAVTKDLLVLVAVREGEGYVLCSCRDSGGSWGWSSAGSQGGAFREGLFLM
jgi:hypothetical protein